MATAETEQLLEANTSDATEKEYFIIDNDLRTISVPDDYILGVESDEDVNRLYFKMPACYGDVDLSSYIIRINYINANNDGDAYLVDDVESDGEYITFSWLVGRKATAYKGNVKFIVCLRTTDDNATVTSEFNTTIATLTILEGLETTEAIVEENSDLINQLLAIQQENAETVAELVTTAESAISSVNEVVESATSAIEQATSSAAEATEKANAAAENANTTAENVTENVETAITEAESKIATAVENANTATSAANTAAENANSTMTEISENVETALETVETFETELSEKLDSDVMMITEPVNIFDPDKEGAVLENKKLATSGGTISDSDSACIYVVDVKVGDELNVYVNGSCATGGVVPAQGALFVDGEYKQYVRKTDDSGTYVGNGGSKEGSFKIPDVDGNLQLYFPLSTSTWQSYIRKINVVYANADVGIPTYSYDYTNTVTSCTEKNMNIRENLQRLTNVAYKPYVGKKILFLGDSITSLGLWVREFSAIVRPSTIANFAKASATWSYNSSSRNDAMNHVDTYIAEYEAGNVFKPDCAILSYGINDGIAKFSADFDVNVAKFYADSAEVETETEQSNCTTVTLAMRYCIETLRAAFPDMQIFICTPNQTKLTSTNNYINHHKRIQNIQQVCEIMSVPCWDTHNCGIYEYTESQENYLLTDGTHETPLGSKIHGYYNARKFIEFYNFDPHANV